MRPLPADDEADAATLDHALDDMHVASLKSDPKQIFTPHAFHRNNF
jgi:hypothetical protein